MGNLFHDRESEILEAIVREYIATGQPVSSATVVTKYITSISSATVRSVMSALEERGFLVKIHGFSGRIPSTEGMRYYINILMDRRNPENSRVQASGILGVDASLPFYRFITEFSRAISSNVHSASFVTMPDHRRLIITKIEITRISARRILVVIIFENDIVGTHMVTFEEDINSYTLVNINNYLEEVCLGKRIVDIRARLAEDISSEKYRYDKLFAGVRAIVDELYVSEGTGDIVVEGSTNLLDSPEIAGDVERMKTIFGSINDKGFLLHILDRLIDTDDVSIFLGGEKLDGLTSETRMDGLSIVYAPYGRPEEDHPGYLGLVGIIGPARMDYEAALPLVGFFASTVHNKIR